MVSPTLMTFSKIISVCGSDVAIFFGSYTSFLIRVFLSVMLNCNYLYNRDDFVNFE